jgi:hypothetical protein
MQVYITETHEAKVPLIQAWENIVKKLCREYHLGVNYELRDDGHWWEEVEEHGHTSSWEWHKRRKAKKGEKEIVEAMKVLQKAIHDKKLHQVDL